MATTIGDVRKAIGDQLRSRLSPGVNIDVDNEGKPAPVLRLRLSNPPVEYWGTFGESGIQTVRFVLEVDPSGVDQSAVKRLDSYLDVGSHARSSVVDALMSDTSLGGIAETLTIDGLSYIDRSGELDPSILAEFELNVVVKKSGAQA